MIPFAEHQLQIAFRQFVRSGDTIYDAGANQGWLAKPLSDLVGPNGHVVCFEPSPRNLAILRSMIDKEKLSNTTVVDAALYHTSGIELEIYQNAFSNADSLYAREADSEPVSVSSLTLDDYIAATQNPPTFVKVDIEGAEHDLLLGSKDLISKHRPIFVLETKPDDLRPFELMISSGYAAYNLMSLEAVTDASTIFDGRLIEDLIYLPTPEIASFYGRTNESFTESSADLEGLVIDVPLRLRKGMNCVRIWGGCTVNPYEHLTVQLWLQSRVVVSTVDQLILSFRPYYQCLVYASKDLTATIRLSRQENPLYVDRVATRCVPMTPAEHRRHEALSIIFPFGN